MTLDISYDVRWIGSNLSIMNLHGQVLMQVEVTSKIQTINVSNIPAGMYILTGRTQNGETLKQKFIKLQREPKDGEPSPAIRGAFFLGY